MNLGQNRVLKEVSLEIREDGSTNGFIELVSKGKVTLKGKVTKLNDKNIFQAFSQPAKLKKELKNKFPIRIHFKTKNAITEKDNIWEDCPSKKQETAKEYLNNFNSNWNPDAKIYSIQIEGTQQLNVFGSVGKSYNIKDQHYDIRLGVKENFVEILEAKNVPGLKDVTKNE